MKNLKLTFGLKNEVAVLSTQRSAYSFASKCVKPHVVILGDNGKFWVVSFADGQRLSKLNYELAK